MKYVLILILLFAGVVVATPCSVYLNEFGCEEQSCFWCERCNDNEANQFNFSTCVDSSVDCYYGCSVSCGSECASNLDCGNNLTDTTCFYSGSCSFCECDWQAEHCPKPGRYEGSVCYYGERSCGENGCSVRSCVMKPSETCDATDGCVSCGKDFCGRSGEHIKEYECRGDDRYGDRAKYACNATECVYEEMSIFLERCEHGCFNGECKEGLCNREGIEFDCDERDGYYGNRFCVGNDIYLSYRDYSCVDDDCRFIDRNILQDTCDKCFNGKCVVEDEPIDNATITVENTTDKPTIITGPTMTFHRGKTIHNGFLFGKSDLTINTLSGGDGYINFTIGRTNRLGSLQITSGGETFPLSNPKPGTYVIPFTNIGSDLTFSTTSSGFFFFAPAIYEIRTIIVYYE